VSDELLSQLTLARADIDRVEHRRDDTSWWLSAQDAPSTRVLLIHRGQAPIVESLGATRLVLVGAEQIPACAIRVLLGVDSGGSAYIAALLADDDPRPVPASTEDPHADIEWRGLRECGAELDARDAGLFVSAAALANWHRAHPACPRCGVATEPSQAGWSRSCPQDASQHFPRSDPAVIVLVTDDQDRALLGRRVDWDAGFYSTFAGFVEAGESAEMTVHRELFEEAGVRVERLKYLGSQPWPFPASLMLGYRASVTADSPTARPDGSEIAEVRWFTRAELSEACDRGEVRVPPAVSIARRLIENWYGQELDGQWSRP
jgi:NAD+ diphosphatase